MQAGGKIMSEINAKSGSQRLKIFAMCKNMAHMSEFTF